jgi:hypothetical protein
MVPPPADDAPPGGRDGAAGGSDTGEKEAQPGAAGDSAGERSPIADGAETRSVLLEVLADPSGATNQLPYVLTQLESDEQPVRLLAATACCLIAVEADDDRIVEYLIRRMSDRLTDEEVSLELTAALDYLSSAFPGQVEPVLAELTEDRHDVPLPRVGDFSRSYYYGREMGSDGSGRPRTAGQREGDADAAGRDGVDDRAGDGEEAPDRTEGGARATNSEATVDPTTDVTEIAVQSRFDELHIRGERHRGRYATTYEALVGDGSDQQAVALRLLGQPEQAVLSQFDRELGEQLARWEAASDHANVVTVFDWDVTPQPWVATALIGGALAGRDRPSPAVAFRDALALADAISHLHGNGVVHGGLDSRTVVYPGEQFDEGTERGPLVNNVGLVTVLRHYSDPADRLDPRFAAPEYYDDRFGRIGRATDIYQLGTVYYRLFTGRPPFTGEFEAVRRAVLSKTPPAPSAVIDGLPAELDEILAKTMAKQKLRRYETVEQLRGELAGLAGEYG